VTGSAVTTTRRAGVAEAATASLAALTVAAGQEDRWDMLLVVRHADAGDKGSWDGPDVGRPLSPAGCRQAEGLVVRLEDYPVDRILCSPTVRRHQTVQPLASNRLLEIEAVAALGVDAGPAEVLALFWDRRLRNAVLCTHGETIRRLLSQLAADGLVTAAPLQWPKGSTWLLQRTAPPQVRARYLAPLTLGSLMEIG
jgi:8-oxo-(d)GTP phosphatase